MRWDKVIGENLRREGGKVEYLSPFGVRDSYLQKVVFLGGKVFLMM